MNFVAHALIAARGRQSSPYAFGAMVPDLRGLAVAAELRPPDTDAAHVDAGVRSHHRADRAFHGNAMFRMWVTTVSQELGDGRAARAAAHVAVELAIDGQLLDAGRAGAFYDALGWGREVLDGPWHSLVVRLGSDELVDAYRTADGVAARTMGAIGRRERLRRLELDSSALARAIGRMAPTIASDLDGLLEAVATS